MVRIGALLHPHRTSLSCVLAIVVRGAVPLFRLMHLRMFVFNFFVKKEVGNFVFRVLRRACSLVAALASQSRGCAPTVWATSVVEVAVPWLVVVLVARPARWHEDGAFMEVWAMLVVALADQVLEAVLQLPIGCPLRDFDILLEVCLCT